MLLNLKGLLTMFSESATATLRGMAGYMSLARATY